MQGVGKLNKQNYVNLNQGITCGLEWKKMQKL